MAEGKALSIAYEGNIVDLLQYALDNDKKVELLSDQTSCHAVYDGGYCPQGISFEERTRLLAEDHDEFVRLVNKTLKKHSNSSRPSSRKAHTSSTTARLHARGI